MNLRLTLVALCIICLSPTGAAAAVIHVPVDQPTIQAGIDAAKHGDTVLVADGTYTGDGNRDLTFQGIPVTVRSENGPELCIIDCGSTPQNPHKGFNILSGQDVVLQGFTITHGMGDTDGFGEGGGIFTYGSTLQVENCTIKMNEAHLGGGIFAQNAVVEIRNCRIEANDGGGIHCNSCEGVIAGNSITENRFGLGAGIHAGFSRLLISENTITGNETWEGGGGIGCISGIGTVIVGNTIADNLIDPFAEFGGCGILCRSVDALHITDNVITGNTGPNYGGGISCEYTSPNIEGNLIQGNSAYMGGAVRVLSGSPHLKNNLIIGNQVSGYGGAVHCINAAPRITGCTMADNHADTFAGAVYCNSGSSAVIRESILWGNTPDQVYIISPGQADITWCAVEGGWPGEHNLVEDPLFTTGPLGHFYLRQTVCGDQQNSPCVDAGHPETPPFGTTGCTLDTSIIDIGYHYPVSTIVAGPGPAPGNPPLVRVFPAQHSAAPLSEFDAYGATGYGVNLCCGDVDGDRKDDLITGPGPGEIYGPHVRGFTADGTTLDGLSFMAYGTSTFGVNVATGDLDRDGIDELITGAGPGAVFGPHVRSWSYDEASGVIPNAGVSYFAYGTPKWGVNVSAGDIDGDGYDEIVTGPGPGAVYGPHVRGWNVDGGTATAIPGVSYFAYGTLKYGVNVTCGDVDGDGIDEIVTGAGPGAVFGPHVRGWNVDGDTVTPLPGFSLFAWLTGPQRYGVEVHAGADVNGDGLDDLITGRGPAPEADTEVKVFTYVDGVLEEWMAIEAFEGMTHGATVAAGRF